MKNNLIFILFLLASVMPAMADSYITFSVNDTLMINPTSLADYVSFPLRANFDGRLDNWDIHFTTPNGFSIDGFRKKSGMHIGYKDSNGTDQDYLAPVYCHHVGNNPNLSIDSLSSTITQFGYWDPQNDGTYESYGTVKWDAGGYDSLVSLIFYVDEDFHSGIVSFNCYLSSTSDARGGTIGDTVVTYSRSIYVFVGLALGDVDQSGSVNIADVSTLVDYLMHRVEFNQYQMEAADVDGDGVVGISDVSALIDMLQGMGFNDIDFPTI